VDEALVSNWTDELNDDQKAQLWDFIVLVVTEIREQIVADIDVTAKMWEKNGMSKSRRTRKAFEACKDIAMGLNESRLIPQSNEAQNIENKTNSL
jgi:hypothetical protein